MRGTKHLRSKQRHVTVGREGSSFCLLVWRESQSPRKTLPNPHLVNKKHLAVAGALRCPSLRNLSSISVSRAPKAANPKPVSPVCCNRKPESSPRLEKLAVRHPSVPHLYARQLFGSERRFLQAFTLTCDPSSIESAHFLGPFAGIRHLLSLHRCDHVPGQERQHGLPGCTGAHHLPRHSWCRRSGHLRLCSDALLRRR